MAKKWIGQAVPASHVGGLHRALHVPEGEPIPAAKLNKALKSKDQHLRAMAQFAKNKKGLGS